MAPAKKAATIAVTPPTVTRSGRKSQITSEVVAGMVSDIENGDYAAIPADTESGMLEYPTKDGSGSDKAKKAARGAASSVAVRHKKAIVNSNENEINDPSELKTRVWEVRENVFVWAVGAKVSVDDESGEDGGEDAE